MYRLAPQTTPDALELIHGTRRLRIMFPTESIARITLTDDKPFKTTPSLIVTHRDTFTAFRIHETETEITASTQRLRIVVNKPTGALAYFDAQGKILVREPARGGKWLTEKRSTKTSTPPTPPYPPVKASTVPAPPPPTSSASSTATPSRRNSNSSSPKTKHSSAL
ncbi:MAG: DUF4968 domain-containing protein [Nibricoccus sp.]